MPFVMSVEVRVKEEEEEGCRGCRQRRIHEKLLPQGQRTLQKQPNGQREIKRMGSRSNSHDKRRPRHNDRKSIYSRCSELCCEVQIATTLWMES
jgi:hypothetical protein